MDESPYKKIVETQRQFFATGATKSIAFRIEQLKKLKSLIQQHENEIITVLQKDLNKSRMEAFTQEILFVLDEINFILKNLKKWAKPRKAPTPFPLMWPGRSEIVFEPYGTVLIISPWNFPFLLTLSPVIGAICAGNCVVIKPSEIASHTENFIVKLFKQNFPEKFIATIQGGPEQTQQLLKEKFDYIFYTGGSQIGKIIMEAAAKHLTPVTLELGGKSPCIVDQTADLDFTARRIAWGKLSNAGQICIAPDYLLVHESCKAQLIDALKKTIIKFYGAEPEKSSSYGRIISQKQFARLSKLLEQGNIIYGGQTKSDQLYISPSLIDGISWDNPIMQEEIFGPILPILTYDSIDTVIQKINSNPKPLALYLFSQDKKLQNKILNEVSFGGGCINDCVMQVANVNLPFGGVGFSGIGQYHGQFSFETFSHRKSIYKKTWKLDFEFLYPPYTMKKLNLVRRLMRL